MNWFFSIVRVAGASFPLTASLAQLQTEIDSAAIQKRLQKLEDPLSSLHPDIRKLSSILYEALPSAAEPRVTLTADQYSQYARPLALLEAEGQIRGTHAIGAKFVNGLWITAPTYIAYMSALFEDPGKMDTLLARVDETPPGTWIHGEPLSQELGLPLPIVQAIFRIYEAKGLGLCSKTIGIVRYLAQA